jgi:hypothetical protein
MAEPIGLDTAGFRPSYRPEKGPAGIDPDMKRMGLVAAGIGGVLALLAGGSLLMRPAHHGVPVIEAEAGPVRIKPDNPGGMQVSGADMGAGLEGQGPHLAPAAEQPELATLRAQMRNVQKQLARQAAENALLARKAADSAQMAKLAEATASHPKLVAAAAPIERASATARVPAIPPILMPMLPPSAVVTAKTTAVSAEPNVQLAAFADQAAARAEWDALVQRQPALLGGRKPEISRADTGGRTMWRLRTGGFGTVADAAGFCAKMRAHNEECEIAAF